MKKSIIIIGAGIGGLAGGIYALKNGYDVSIFEMGHNVGGQCASWNRKGYTFDACIHHLMGCKEGTKINKLWKEIGAYPFESANTCENVAVADTMGNVFYDYYDLAKLKTHMEEIAPKDKKMWERYIEKIHDFSQKDFMGTFLMGSFFEKIKLMPLIIKNLKYFKMNMQDYANMFSDSFLKKAFAYLEYSIKDIPIAVHFGKRGAGSCGDIKWPEGASSAFMKNIEKRYLDLGGKLNFGNKVVKILTKANKAVGIELNNGEKHYGDIIISNADGRKTIYEMLDGKYKNKHTDDWSKLDDKAINWGTMVYLGVNRDLSKEPSALILLLEKSVELTDIEANSLELQIYGFDKTMAPEGKGVIKAELVTKYSYWDNQKDYEEKKKEVTKKVTDILEGYFAGITDQVETVDVVTFKTWEKFMGGTHGYANQPNKPFGFSTFLQKPVYTLEGLENFYMAGVWVTATGALFSNALSGKNVVKLICKKDKKRFLYE